MMPALVCHSFPVGDRTCTMQWDGRRNTVSWSPSRPEALNKAEQRQVDIGRAVFQRAVNRTPDTNA